MIGRYVSILVCHRIYSMSSGQDREISFYLFKEHPSELFYFLKLNCGIGRLKMLFLTMSFQ